MALDLNQVPNSPGIYKCSLSLAEVSVLVTALEKKQPKLAAP